MLLDNNVGPEKRSLIMKINVAHSPDADDFFLFWAIRKALIDTNGFEFSFVEADTEDLNNSAINSEFDVCAISLATYPLVAKNYLILPHGASVGRNFGPVVIAKKNFAIEELNSLIVGIPGKNTTAALLFKQIAPQAKTKEIPIRPYSAVFEALEKQEIAAAVVIHEGQIDYASKDCVLLLDLGKWWYQKTKLPIPLGINVIKKSLGEDIIFKVSSLIRNSINYSLKNQDLLLPQLFEFTQKSTKKLGTLQQLKKYLSMYANEDSAELKEDCAWAMEELLGPEVRLQYSA